MTTCIDPDCTLPACGESTLCAVCLARDLGFSCCPRCGGEGGLSWSGGHAGHRLTLILNLLCVDCWLGEPTGGTLAVNTLS